MRKYDCESALFKRQGMNLHRTAIHFRQVAQKRMAVSISNVRGNIETATDWFFDIGIETHARTLIQIHVCAF